MRTNSRSLVAIAVLAVLLAGCRAQAETVADDKPEPAHVEHVEGSEIGVITLTDAAAARLGIQSETVEQGLTSRRAIPYAALIYDPHGDAWAYVERAPLTYARERLGVVDIRGDRVVIDAGPTPGARVVTVGVAELYGVEFGVGH